MRTNLERFQDFMDSEIKSTENVKDDKVYYNAGEHFCDAMSGCLYRTPEDYRKWLIHLMEAFREGRTDIIGEMLYTTVYQSVILDYEKGKLEFLDYED